MPIDVDIDQALLLVTRTTLTVFKISDRLGFQHSSNFSRWFKRMTGLSPHHYRQRYRDPAPLPLDESYTLKWIKLRDRSHTTNNLYQKMSVRSMTDQLSHLHLRQVTLYEHGNVITTKFFPSQDLTRGGVEFTKTVGKNTHRVKLEYRPTDERLVVFHHVNDQYVPYFSPYEIVICADVRFNAPDPGGINMEAPVLDEAPTDFTYWDTHDLITAMAAMGKELQQRQHTADLLGHDVFD